MSRVSAALILGLFGVCAAFGTVGVTAAEKTARAPARQVPVKPIDVQDEKGSNKPAKSSAHENADKKESDKPAEEQENKPVNRASGAPDGGTGVKTPAKKPHESAARRRAPAKKEKSSGKAKTAIPGLPVRKPRKPVFSKSAEKKKTKKEGVPGSPSARNKRLCKALQACRNGFIKCKSKIEYPDQSEPWIIAKEECGAKYKTCVEKDFQPGEWFFTRWFYFQELKCE